MKIHINLEILKFLLELNPNINFPELIDFYYSLLITETKKSALSLTYDGYSPVRESILSGKSDYYMVDPTLSHNDFLREIAASVGEKYLIHGTKGKLEIHFSLIKLSSDDYRGFFEYLVFKEVTRNEVVTKGFWN